MNEYTCPICHKKTPRDLAMFLDHANQHIIDSIQESHPDWKKREGLCEPCLEYYKKEMGKSEDSK